LGRRPALPGELDHARQTIDCLSQGSAKGTEAAARRSSMFDGQPHLAFAG
jgi:hypothetical protein